MIKGSIKNTTLQALAQHLDIRGLDECWPWLGNVLPNGYGVLYGDGKKQYVHVVAFYGEGLQKAPPGMDIDHICHDQSCQPEPASACPHRRCANPAHLAVTTHRANSNRGNSPPANNSRRTNCSKGHLFDAENTHLRPTGKRECRTCHRAEVMASYQPVKVRRPAPRGRSKTHCPAGHLYAETLAIWPNGRRYCRPCRTDYLNSRKASISAGKS